LKPDKPPFLVKYMPIYEYRCESCGAELEKIQKLSDAPLTDCPSCGKAELKKLVSASSFRLKGSGWYETDFKNKSKPSSDTQTAPPAATGSTANSNKDNSASAKSGDSGSKDKKETKGSEKASAKSSKDSNN